MLIKRKIKKEKDLEKPPKRGVYILPNALTLCGMFLGFYAIISTINEKYLYAAWAIILANIFDGLDGLIARLTRTTTRFGIELDSLSDLVTFGIAPAILIYKWGLLDFGRVGFAVAFLFTACGALRLARFNVQVLSIKSFKGLPTPGAATLIASLVVFCIQIVEYTPRKNPFFLILTVLLSFLMVSNLKFHALKEIDFKKKKPFWLLIIFIIILFFIVVHPPVAVFVLVSIYVVSGIIENIVIFIKKKKKIEVIQDEKNKNF
ncbi:MAG: CDP-diacylglycerol--serine O-phosphatidyltransferase [Thermodesulfovibrionaceae bacterium]